MFSNIKFLSIFGLFFGFTHGTAQAVVLMNCPSATPAPFGHIYVSSFAPKTQSVNRPNPRMVTCGDVDQIVTVVRGVNQIFKGLIAPPRSMDLNFLPLEDNAFSGGHAFLHLPREIIIDDLAKNPSFTTAIWAHEYGHTMLLNAFMQRDRTFAQLGTFLDQLVQADMQNTIFQEDYEILQIRAQAAKQSGDIKLLSSIETQQQEVIQKAQQLQKNALGIQGAFDFQIFRVLSPYNEFFADLVALIYTGKPNSVSAALFRMSAWQNMQKTRKGIAEKCLSCRDFSARENSIEQWIRLRSMGKALPTESHDVLAPARYYVWSRYFRAGSAHQFPAHAASRVLDVIRAIVVKRAANPALQSEVPDPIAMNMELMEGLDRALR